MTGRPGVAIIVNEQTPYRLHLHRRIVNELPEIRLWSLFTHQVASSPWRYQEAAEINPVLFGAGESTANQSSLRNSLREYRKGGAIAGWLKEHAIRAVVLFGYNDLCRLRLVRWCRANQTPCFLFGDSNILGDNPRGLQAIVKRAYVPWVIRQCSGVFHCGRLGRDYFLRYGADPSRLYPFPYEPDYNLFSAPDPRLAEEMSAKYELTRGRRRLLFVGRLTRTKRPDLVIEAFDRIADQRPDWDLVVAGDGDMRAELQQQPAWNNHANRIRWTGFLDDAAKLASLYSICDVFVLPSDYEPWGVVVTEAATQLALVASSVVGAAADVLKDGVNGKWFPAGDLGALAHALLEVTEPQAIDRMKAASPHVLEAWRAQSDPVRHLRQALSDCGVL